MTITLAHLGPQGTYAEAAAAACAAWWYQRGLGNLRLVPYPSIVQTLEAVLTQEATLAIVPVENSTEGSVTVTLDSLWQLDGLQIRQAWVLPIAHALLSHTPVEAIETIYSHPQALAQCQRWLEARFPNAALVPTRSTAEAVQGLDNHAAAIASRRAATLYRIPVLAEPINDYPDNCTRFWVVSRPNTPFPQMQPCSHTSLAFSLPINQPGALLQPLRIFADKGINLSRIESRPTKRSLGEYLFFLDLEAGSAEENVKHSLNALEDVTETLKLLGSYSILQAESDSGGMPN